MSRKIASRPVIKPASEWVREAPAGATALIVAECTTKGRATPSRRIALGWLNGERDQEGPLRSAAAKLQDMLNVSASDLAGERRESDGSVSLMTSARCQIQWIIRSIPVGIIQCWTGFEDGITPPPPAVEHPSQPASVDTLPSRPSATPGPAPTAPAIKSVPISSSRNASTVAPTPVENPYRPQRTSDPTPAYPTKTLPSFAPLAALILNPKEAFGGNCASADGAFITDGHMMLLRSACDKSFIAKLKQTKCGPYGPDNPVPESSTRKLFESTVQEARYDASVHGYILAASAGIDGDPVKPLACIVGPGERVSIANGHKLLHIQRVTGANGMKVSVDPKSPRLTLFKDEQPVAVLLTFESPTVIELFQRMLPQESNRTNISSLSSITARRAAG